MVRPHRVSYNNQPLYADTFAFTWMVRSGTSPAIGRFTVPVSRVGQFWPPTGPGTLVMDITWRSAGEDKEKSITFTNISITELDYQDVNGVEVAVFTIKDLRYKWRGLIAGARFNHPRRVNDADIRRAGDPINVPGQQQQQVIGGIAPVEPARIVDGEIQGFVNRDVLAPYRATPKYAYRKLTLKADGTPWTALEAVEGILNGYDVLGFDGNISGTCDGILDEGEWGGRLQNLTDNKLEVNRVNFQGAKVQGALDFLCRKARCRIGVWPNGKVYLYPVDVTDPTPFLPNQKTAEGITPLYQKTYWTERPAKVITHFPIEKEEQFHSVLENETVVREEPLVKMVMRLPIPATIDLGEGPREYPPGTFVPYQDDVLAALKLTLDFIRRYYHSPDFLRAYIQERSDGDGDIDNPTPIEIRIVGAIRSSFLRLFKIDERWVDRIVDIKAETVTVLDAVSGKRQASPVWTDYVIVRSASLLVNRTLDVSAPMMVNSTFRQSMGVPLPDEPAGPFEVAIVDKDLGVFQINEAADWKGLTQQFALGNIDDSPEAVMTADSEGTITDVTIRPTHHVAVILTIMRLDPNCKEQYHAIEVSAADVGMVPGLNPKVERFISDETARFDKDGTLVNSEMLRARATSEALIEWHTWKSRWTGIVAWTGLHDVPLFGPALAVRYEMLPSGNFRTVLDMSEPIPPRSVEQLLRPDLRHAMNRQLPPQ